MDEIASRARANKAMIYYHFGTKQGLYQAVLLGLFGGVLREVERIEREVTGPAERLLAFYTGLIGIFTKHPDLPRIMMREVLARGTHVDKVTAQVLGAILRFVGACIAEGAARGLFRPVNPLLVHLSMIGLILVFFVSEPFRARIVPEALPKVSTPTPDDLVAYLRDLLASLLTAEDRPTGNRS